MHDLKDLLCAISIHALLAESDEVFPSQSALVSYFYPRSPCGERRKWIEKNGVKHGFLSTLSLRRATSVYAEALQAYNYFYPRSPCGERHSPFQP